MDHAATTPVDPAVLAAMQPYWIEHFGNPSSIYQEGRRTRRAMDEARDAVAEALGAASPAEVIFTSGGSEADNLALQGVAWGAKLAGSRRDHIVVSAVEHHAVLDTARFLARQGFAVSEAPVDGFGRVDLGRLRELVSERTLLISVMHANNEVGTVQPLAEVAAIAREVGAFFHTDAVQTVGILPVSVQDLGCDLLTLSAHKLYGPKGVGALYVRRGVPLAPLIHGGGQERERRAGTENVAGVVGLAAALRLALAHREERAAHLTRLRDRLVSGVLRQVPGARLNGHPTERLPGNAHFLFPGVDGESLLLNLDLRGVAASSGSACTSGSLEPSHVLLAMGVPKPEAHGSLRLSLGKDNTEEEVDAVVALLAEVVERLRGSREG